MNAYWRSVLSNYVVIDVETTGRSNSDRLTQLAAVRYVDGEEVDSFASYVNPHKPIPFIVREKTGITDEMVAEAPDVEAVLPDYLAFLRKAPVVTGYNVRFDLRFLSAASGENLAESLDWFDAMEIAKKSIPGLPHYRLSDICERIGYQTDFHDALNDCRACAAVLSTIESGDIPRACSPVLTVRAACGSRPDKKEPDIQVVADGQLAGKNVVLTGELTFSRECATALLESAGAFVKKAVSSKIDFLITGDRVVTMGPSVKEKKAAELIAGGGKIRIINEAELVQMLEGKELEAHGAAEPV